MAAFIASSGRLVEVPNSFVDVTASSLDENRNQLWTLEGVRTLRQSDIDAADEAKQQADAQEIAERLAMGQIEWTPAQIARYKADPRTQWDVDQRYAANNPFRGDEAHAGLYSVGDRWFGGQAFWKNNDSSGWDRFFQNVTQGLVAAGVIVGAVAGGAAAAGAGAAEAGAAAGAAETGAAVAGTEVAAGSSAAAVTASEVAAIEATSATVAGSEATATAAALEASGASTATLQGSYGLGEAFGGLAAPEAGGGAVAATTSTSYGLGEAFGGLASPEAGGGATAASSTVSGASVLQAANKVRSIAGSVYSAYKALTASAASPRSSSLAGATAPQPGGSNLFVGLAIVAGLVLIGAH